MGGDWTVATKTGAVQGERDSQGRQGRSVDQGRHYVADGGSPPRGRWGHTTQRVWGNGQRRVGGGVGRPLGASARGGSGVHGGPPARVKTKEERKGGNGVPPLATGGGEGGI